MISQVKIQTESGYWGYAPPENFLIKGLENLPFSAETSTEENAVVSCLFYPSLVLSVKVDFHCRVIYRAYTRKFYARKMYQSSRFNDKKRAFSGNKKYLFFHVSVACVQTSPLSFFACNKGNKRRLHAGKCFGYTCMHGRMCLDGRYAPGSFNCS